MWAFLRADFVCYGGFVWFFSPYLQWEKNDIGLLWFYHQHFQPFTSSFIVILDCAKWVKSGGTNQTDSILLLLCRVDSDYARLQVMENHGLSFSMKGTRFYHSHSGWSPNFTIQELEQKQQWKGFTFATPASNRIFPGISKLPPH